MAKTKVWRVKADFDGKVALESEETRVVLSNTLPQEQLAELAKDPMAAGFMEKAIETVQPQLTDGTQGAN